MERLDAVGIVSRLPFTHKRVPTRLFCLDDRQRASGRVGQEVIEQHAVEVLVLEVDPSGRRIRLSRKAVLDAKEKDEVRDYAERSGDSPTEGFGSLAEKLRGAIRKK